MPNRLFDRQHSLLVHLTSGATIFGGRTTPVDPALVGIDSVLLRLEARFSHEKRMKKIVGVFPRTFKFMSREWPSVECAFAEACPPVAIGRLENARQFHDFLLSRWRQQRPKPRYLPDVAACELAFAEALNITDAGHTDGDVPAAKNLAAESTAIRRRPGVVLLRCRYDIRALFETGLATAPPAKRDVALAIATSAGIADPGIFELDDAVFELLAALDDWTESRPFGETPDARALVAGLAAYGLLEFCA
jgi:hypothetical protein